MTEFFNSQSKTREYFNEICWQKNKKLRVTNLKKFVTLNFKLQYYIIN